MRDQIHSGVDLKALRQKMEKRDAAGARMDKGFKRENFSINDLSLDWIKTSSSLDERVFLYLHGGGFCFRTPIMHGQFLASLCKNTASTGLMPGYRLAPEHLFPAAFNDCLASYLWLLEKGYQPKNIILGGDSAGGALSLGLLIHLRDEGLPLPACAILISPGLDPTFSGPSMQNNKEKENMFTPDALEAFFNAYLPDDLREDERLALLDYDYGSLPPILIQAGGNEILLDDSVRAAERAKDAGVDVELQIFENMSHVFQLFSWLPETKKARKNIISFIDQHLS